MSSIEKINQKISEMVSEGYLAIEALMELALNAGLKYFNPCKATETELEIIAKNI
jgi:hypothetical protein